MKNRGFDRHDVAFFIVMFSLVVTLLMFPSVRGASVSTLRLAPDDQISSDWDASPASPDCDPTGMWCRTNEWPNDGNATTVGTVVGGTIGVKFRLSNLPPGIADADLINVTAFVWAREAAAETMAWYVNDSVAQCASGSASTTPAWANYTKAWNHACDGDDWTVARVNALILSIAETATGSGLNVTSAGVTVTYYAEATASSQTTLLLGFLVFILLLILGLWLHPAFLIFAGLVGIFLGFQVYAITGEWWLTGVMFAVSGLLMLGGAIDIARGRTETYA